MSESAVTLNLERLVVSDFAGGKGAVRAVAAKGASPAASSGPSHELRKSSVRLVQSEELGRPVVEILDRETGEVIYQIPPEELQKLSAFLDEIRGSVINELA